MIRAALIGVSNYGRVHLRMIDHLLAKRKLELVAATVINQEEEAELCEKLSAAGCELYRDYREMLQVWLDKIDLCMIPTPIFLHEEMTIAALRARANVLIEKPLTPGTEGCQAIIEEAERCGRFVAVGFQKMHSPATLRIKRDLLSGVIGELREIRGITLWPRTESYFSRNSWAGRIRVGGALALDSPVSNAAAHFLHLMLFWAGDGMRSVDSIADGLEAETYRANRIQNFDTASLRGVTAAGVRITFVTSHASREPIEPIIRIIGSKGEIEWVKDQAACYRVHGEPERRIELTDEEEEVRAMIEAIAERIEGGDAALCEPAQALPHAEVVERLHNDCGIQTIPERFIEVVTSENGPMRVVTGLEEIAMRAFDRGALFSEAGAPWASPRPPSVAPFHSRCQSVSRLSRSSGG